VLRALSSDEPAFDYGQRHLVPCTVADIFHGFRKIFGYRLGRR
jgi:hypothetical protein